MTALITDFMQSENFYFSKKNVVGFLTFKKLFLQHPVLMFKNNATT